MFLRKAIVAAAALLPSWSTAAGDLPEDVKAIHLMSHSLQQPYLDSNMQSRWWDFGGNAIVRADAYVRLTGAHHSQSGYMVSRIPLTATNWEVEFEFKISGTGHLFGDGFAMWVTKDRVEQGEVFGMKDKFEGLGIFFDTYKNNRPGVIFPYVMAMVGDGQTSYDKANDGKANELAGCQARGIRNQGIATKARVTYFQEQSLKVELSYKNEDEWTLCFETGAVKLPGVTYLGFSAETGELSDNHDIVKVETRNLYSRKGGSGGNSAAGSTQYSKGKGRPDKPHRQGTGSWFAFLLKAILVIGVLGVVGYIAFTAYRSKSRRDRF